MTTAGITTAGITTMPRNIVFMRRRRSSMPHRHRRGALVSSHPLSLFVRGIIRWKARISICILSGLQKVFHPLSFNGRQGIDRSLTYFRAALFSDKAALKAPKGKGDIRFLRTSGKCLSSCVLYSLAFDTSKGYILPNLSMCPLNRRLKDYADLKELSHERLLGRDTQSKRS
jgi:hypothetical protein